MSRLALALVVAVLAGAACGKYGPPVRPAAEHPPAAKTPPVGAAPAAPDTEQCPDPEQKP